MVYCITQGEIANLLGITLSAVSRMESSPNFRFSTYQMTTIADYFQADLETLVRVDLCEELEKIISKKPKNTLNNEPTQTPINP
ncbi:MAG: helix-turn-helix domain-containing protein [Nanoarchaeota archaeon]|nr:helix-turn-helix domain-containing protein [Nanoarchaeota archaeon]